MDGNTVAISLIAVGDGAKKLTDGFCAYRVTMQFASKRRVEMNEEKTKNYCKCPHDCNAAQCQQNGCICNDINDCSVCKELYKKEIERRVVNKQNLK